MKKTIEDRAFRLPMEVIEAVGNWETRAKVKILKSTTDRRNPDQRDLDPLDPGYQAIAFLVSKGCQASDVIQLLDLLRAYGSDAVFANAKQKRERWLDRAKNLVLRLRRDAKDAEELLGDLIGSRRRPEAGPQTGATAQPSSEESDSDSDQPATVGYPALASATQANSLDQQPDLPFTLEEPDSMFNVDEPELWDVMRDHADNLDSYIKMQQGYNYRLRRRTQADMEFLAAEFTRKFGGTLFYLVLAAELVRKATGSPHYAQLAIILERVCPPKALDAQDLVKKIYRFKQRNPAFTAEIEPGG
jgi:hypothetical protein